MLHVFCCIFGEIYDNFNILLSHHNSGTHFLFMFFARPKLKEHMQYCMNHPEEMNKLSKLKAQITEVKGIMMDNIEKVHF